MVGFDSEPMGFDILKCYFAKYTIQLDSQDQ